MFFTLLKRNFITHYPILLVALFIAIISSVPQYLEHNAVPNFQGVYVGMLDDVVFYQARAQEVLDGHPYLTNPYLYEHKEGSPMQFWIPDYILAKPIGLLGISVPLGFLIWTFFLTAILLLLSYTILLVLTDSVAWSFLGATLLHVGLFGDQFLRLAPPGLTFVFFLLSLLSVLLFLKYDTLWMFIASAFFFGLLFNIYPFYWTYFVIVFGLFIAGSFIINKYFKYAEFTYKKYLYICLSGSIVAIPFFVSLWQSLQMPWYQESARRLGMIATHFPSGIDSVVLCGIVLSLFVFLLYRKVIRLNPTNLLLLSCVCGGGIAVNQHLITGKNVEFSSHYFLGTAYVCSFTLLYLFVIWLRTKELKTQKIFLIIGCCLVFAFSVHGVRNILHPQIIRGDGVAYVQDYAPIFSWLNTHAQKDDVVYADDILSTMIPVYTSQNVLYSSFSILFFMTDMEAENRFIINHYFDTFTPEFVLKNQRMIFGGYYINEYGHNLSKNKLRKVVGLPTQNYSLVPGDILDKVVLDAKVVQKQSFKDVLGKYRVDYIVWDTRRNPEWKLDRFHFLTKVYSDNMFVIYTIK